MKLKNGSEGAFPLVSVIICTRDRPEMLRRARRSVLDQGRTDYEVIIVDDGSQPPVELPESNTAVPMRVVRIEAGAAGAARAAGLESAQGTFIAYCDDDDVWTPDHLHVLLEYITTHPDVDLVYGDSEWAGGDGPKVPYSIPFDASLLADVNFIFPTDVVHRADAAREAGGYDRKLVAHEDWDLWLRMSLSGRGLMRHVDRILATRHAHPDCVSWVHTGWEIRHGVYQAHQDRLNLAGPASRHDIVVEAAKPAPFDKDTWQPGRRELILHTILRPNQGYGQVARQMIVELERQGVDVVIAPTKDQPQAGFERFYKPLDHWGRLGFYYNYLHMPGALPCVRRINYSMRESTHLEPEMVAAINDAVELQYVPCSQNADAYRAAGVTVPVRVLHHGIDPNRWPMLDRLNREPAHVYTFGSFGELTARKGIDVLIRAFQDEFGKHEPVRLLLKSNGRSLHGLRAIVRDDRVSLLTGFLSDQELLELLRQMDAFVMPSRGEGFGLCGLEAMATGLPLIATNWSGPADYLDAGDSYPLNYRMVDAAGTEAHSMRFYGQWAEPDYEHMRALLRHLYENRDEAAARGRAAAVRVHRDWTWERAVRQLVAELDELAGGG